MHEFIISLICLYIISFSSTNEVINLITLIESFHDSNIVLIHILQNDKTKSTTTMQFLKNDRTKSTTANAIPQNGGEKLKMLKSNKRDWCKHNTSSQPQSVIHNKLTTTIKFSIQFVLCLFIT
ncbi:hypothetical protein Pint_33078 [Pistacia integerrima]|uniref:Uncharacterized protein n=1 Tax=Pistacia integerrima TaxID=434235 RepID=A0ACC0XAK0_9ROSI|nr:hypothetical protein Pint_33078 [Pistacia integerrima]